MNNYLIKKQNVQAGDRKDIAYRLSKADTSQAIEIWPGFGFNCLHWQITQNNIKMAF